MDWFKTLVRDLIAGLVVWGFLEAIIEINPVLGKIIALIFTITDYLIYLQKGVNLVNWILGE